MGGLRGEGALNMVKVSKARRNSMKEVNKEGWKK